MAQPCLRPGSWQDKEVHVDWHFLSAARSHYPLVFQVVASVACVPACAQRSSASLGLHCSPWTWGAFILGWGVVALSPPFLSA